LREPY